MPDVSPRVTVVSTVNPSHGGVGVTGFTVSSGEGMSDRSIGRDKWGGITRTGFI